ncbi:MAG: hypothetical protein V3Q69_04955 [Burkholderia sp.]
MATPVASKRHWALAKFRRCCINRARSVDVYSQRSRGQPPIKSDARVTA